MVDEPDLDAQGESEGLEELPGILHTCLIRCKCGYVCDIRVPTICEGCGDAKAYWKTLDNRVLKLSKMTLGHLNNTIRILAAKAETLPAGQRERLEIALDLLYAELGSRDQEISQASGIMAALTRSLNK